ncbi:basic form of pathogenesis-related protein 1-like [Camellia sinensis]|uniref:basic form of pathogenesis-related protein 1-like n=1 Tax=Camellia sinensis TaxID=4442 RepID=UPI00103697C3|nr:basic form of pathogenesis-related protein 1-like [Camellia sinensis]
MEFSKISLVIVSFMALIMTHLSLAQNSPQDFLAPHNAARAEVGVQPVMWNDIVATYALNYANQRSVDCNMQHSQGPYGENYCSNKNLAEGSGEFIMSDAVKMWVDEKVNYDYNSNSCVGGECLHYTQVVWSNTARIGFASV